MLQQLGHGRLDFLDQMRALAIATVLIVHFHSDWLPAGGAVGVGIFFSLSGFLIATLLLEEKTFDFRIAAKFIIRRFMRIYPAYLATVSATVLLTYFFAPENWSAVIRAVPGVLTFVAIPHFIGNAFSALWTLQIEMAFYLMLPAAMLLLGRVRGLLILCVALIAMSLSIFFGFSLDGLLGFSHLSAVQIYAGHLAIGSLVAVTWKLGILRELRLRPRLLASISLLGIALLLCLPLSSGLPWTLEILSASVCGCGLIAAFLLDPELPVVPGTPWIGRISYSLYLVHGIVNDFRFYPDIIQNAAYWFYPSRTVGLAAAYLAVTVCVAALSYRWIEKPGIRLGKRLTAQRPDRAVSV